MVAFVAGNSLGLSLTSQSTLGEDGSASLWGAKGRSGEQVFLNSETGNVVVQGQDEYVAARGLDIGGVRTYNSLGKIVGGVQDSWAVGQMREKVVLSGTWGAAGSTIVRTAADGAEATYTLSGSIYQTTSGPGANDTIAKDGSGNFVWTDGFTQCTETYSSAGKLTKSTDTDLNSISYVYDASGRLSTATGADGELLKYNYTAAGDLQNVTTTLPGGTAKQRVYYLYDTSHRLTDVTVDLVVDGAITDGSTYWTHYTYIGTSNLIDTMSQKDGTALTFSYDAQNRVKTVTSLSSDGLTRQITLTYNTATQTTISDTAGSNIVMQTDASGRLSRIDMGGQLEHSFAYVTTTSDEVQTVTDGIGNVVTYGYDARNNMVSQSDSLANSITRTYNANNTIATEAVGSNPATNYIYYAANPARLHYVVTPDKGVTEYLYDTVGQRTAALTYDTAYAGVLTESAIGTWATALSVDAVNRTDYTYSAFGQLASATVYGAVTSAHAGDTTNALNATTTYTYNTQGQLLTEDEAGLNGPTAGVTTYAYDGMGRQTSITNVMNQVTFTNYDDATNKTTVTFASGLVTASTWDKSGNLISVLSSGTAAGSATTTYAYDADNRTIMATDPAGARSFTLYDTRGRVAGQVDARGALTEFMYDAADNVTRSVTYSTLVPIGSLYNSTTGKAINPALATIRPVAVPASDISVWNVYDTSSRLVKSVGARGGVTQYTYDTASQLVQTKEFANALTAAQMAALGNAPTAAAIAPTADAANDRVTRNFYDAQGLLIGTLDPIGALEEFTYDAAGRLVQHSNYATPTTAVDRAAGTFATLKAEASAGTGHDVDTYLYDARGERVGVIDGRGNLTESVYDVAGRITSTTQYFNPAKTFTTSSTIAAVRPLTNAADITTSCTYDDLGRVLKETDGRGGVSYNLYGVFAQPLYRVDNTGGVTANQYDEMGRVTKTTRYAKPVTGVTAATTIATLPAIPTDPTDQITWFTYDADGRVAATVNALGEVQKFKYDAAGNVIESRSYVNRIAGWTPGSAVTTVDNPDDRWLRTMYDTFGRAIYSVDGTGAVVTSQYDANGNVTQQRSYATPIDPNTFNGTAQVLPATSTADQLTTNLYDSADRLLWTEDGTGAVTRFYYDTDGNVTQRVDYATKVAPGAVPSTTAVSAGNDRITNYVYDALGRQVWVLDALKEATQYQYDNNGNLTQVRAFNAKSTSTVAIGTILSTVAVTADTATNTTDRITRMAYDAENRVVYTVDAAGDVTETTWDGCGNVTNVIQHAKIITGTTFKNLLSTVASISSALGTANAADRQTTNVYYADNTLMTSTDGFGGVATFTYDAIGQIKSRADSGPSTTTRTTSYAYDAAGRLSSTTDALNKTESYGYDGVGNKTSFTNKLQSVWTYSYDAAGRMTDETTPIVDVFTMTDATIGSPVLVWTGITTHYDYDGNGNLMKRTEAYGRTDARVTKYDYDADGRQIRTTFPQFATYAGETDAALAANGQGGAATRAESVSTPVSETYYDAFGNATGGKDVGGKYSYKVYDLVGRVVNEVDALGYVTTYTYDSFGGATSVTHYVASVTPPANATSLTLAQASPATNANDRSLGMVFDNMGRTTKVTEASVSVYDPESTSTTASKSTGTTYNAFGEVVQVQGTRLGGATSPSEYRYYDKAGNLTETVDAGGYITTYSYDALGNVLSKTEYATAFTGAINITTPPTPTVDPNKNDRTTVYAYDLLNQELSETRKNVEATNQDTFVTARGDVVTSYGYDAVGNRISTTTADGTTFTYYDVIGRVNAMAQPVRAGEVSGTITPLTIFRRDVFGDAILQTDFAKGATTATSTAYTVTADVGDRTSYTVYDAAGHALRTMDASGASSYASYDVFGHKVKTWQTVGTGATSATIFAAYKYDADGRLIETRSPTTTGVATPVITTALTYNSFGETILKSINGIAGEYWDYDSAGRLWRTNADGGVDKIYLYDQLGRKTAEMQSAGGVNDKDLRTVFTTAAAAAIDKTLRRTDYKYDLLGRVIQTTEASRLESYSNVDVRDTTVTSHITIPSTATTSDGLNWTWTNARVENTWATTLGMGAGDVQVTVSYFKAVASWDGATVTYSQGALASVTRQFRAEDANIGEWSDIGSDSSTSNVGGVYSVAGVKVEKLKSDGNWQEISNNAPGVAGGNMVEVEKVSGVVSEDIQVLDTQTTGAQWVTIPKTSWYDFGDKYQVDLRAYAPSRYQYRLMGGMAGGAQTVLFTGTLSNTTTTYTGTDVGLRPAITQTVDRWGNTTSMTDARNAAWVTKYDYNANNQMVRQYLPLNAQGLEALTLATTVAYDKMGRQLGSTDANSHTNRVRYDTQGNVIEEIHADGGDITSGYDVFGERTANKDAENHQTTYTYNKQGLLTDITHLGTVWGAITEHTDWDTAGRKLADTNANGEKTQYQYDLRGNIVKVLLPSLATSKTTTYDYADRKATETDGAGGVLKWTYDYFGRVATHNTLAAAASNSVGYTYDKAGQLKAVSGTTGQNLTYSYDAAGQLAQINDTVLHETTTYQYDWSGNKIAEEVMKDGVIYQDNSLAYDALNRLRWVGDDHTYVNITYDLVGNRTHITTHVMNVTGLATYPDDMDRWFTYDQMNRQTAVDAVDSLGNISSTQGHQLQYDKNGNRTLDTHYGRGVVHSTAPNVTYSSVEGRKIVEAYQYNALDQLVMISRPNEEYYIPGDGFILGVDVEDLTYDKTGRLKTSKASSNTPLAYLLALYGTDANGHQIIGNGSQGKTMNYDVDGKLTSQTVDNAGGSVAYTLTNNIWDGAGNVTKYTVTQGATNNVYTTTLAKFDAYKESTVSGVSTTLRPGSTASTYDVNGFLTGVSSTTTPADNRTFVNDASGQVLATNQGGHLERELIVNGEVLAQYGSGVDQITPRDSTGQPIFNDNIASFNFGYRSITPSFPSPTLGNYSVQSGDTLRNIAQTALGDADLWYEIADANHISGDGGLRVGMSLIIPNAISSHNNVNTFVPYDPSKIVGDTTPYLAVPPHDSDTFGMLLAVVIAVIATIYTAGAAASMLAEAAGTTLATSTTFGTGLAVFSGETGLGGLAVAAGAAGGAAGSVAGQLANMGAGNQSSFSWSQVALGAIGGGVSAGVAGEFASGSALAGNSQLSQQIARAAISSAVSQGIGVVTGLQHSFSWQAVAASAVGAGVGGAVGGAIAGTGLGDALGAIGIRAVSGAVGGATTAMLGGGGMTAQQLAVDVFGNALGQGLVDQAGQASTQAMGAAPAANTPFPDGTSTYYAPAKQAADQAELMSAVQRLSEDGVDDYEGTDVAALSGRSGLGLRINPTLAAVGGTGLRFESRLGLGASSPGLGLHASDDLTWTSNLYAGSSSDGLMARFGQGVLGALKGLTLEPILQVRDLSLAGASVAYNEMLRGDGDAFWLPEMKSGVTAAYANGASRTRLFLQSNPLTAPGVASFDMTTAALNGDWESVAEGAGGLVGGLAVGKVASKYGGYGITLEDIQASGPMASQMGAVRIGLVAPSSSGNRLYVVNGDGMLYPEVPDLRTGRSIAFPDGEIARVGKASRVSWDSSAGRYAYIQEWYARGYDTPVGGWKEYDIHHVRPREFGGDNSFWNLTPIQRQTHVQLFNQFWRKY